VSDNITNSKENIRWNILNPDEKIVAHLREAGGFSDAVARVLVNRGFFDIDAVEKFIHPALKFLHDPMKLGGVARAAERVLEAIAKKEKIVIHGDYDADGVTSTTLLMRVLGELGAKVSYFIPTRSEHGYGLKTENIRKLAGENTKVIITVDCGITAIEPAKEAGKLGIDLIITDHHEPKIEELDEEYDLSSKVNLFEHAIENGTAKENISAFNHLLPDACAIINPKLGHYPFSELAGVGVAFKLAHGIVKLARAKKLKKSESIDLKKYMDIVALGTIADSVPLRGENRIIVKYGLKAIGERKNPGFQKLIEISRVQRLDARTVAFTLAPRVNAAGRLADAGKAVELFLTTDGASAEIIANELDFLNKKRQKIERETLAEAIKVFESSFEADLPDRAKLPGGLHKYLPDGPKVIVAASENWEPGVIGIVASRMVERYYLPAIIISIKDKKGRGSCRSTRDFHLFDALRQCEDLLEKFGGHRFAAGLTVSVDKIDDLREMLNKNAAATLQEESYVPVLDIEAELKLKDCTTDFVETLEKLKPYGQNNPPPFFVIRNVKLVDDPRILKEKHLKFTVMQEGEYRDIIAFGWAEYAQQIVLWAKFDVVVQPSLNFFRGSAQVELKLIDAKEVY